MMRALLSIITLAFAFAATPLGANDAEVREEIRQLKQELCEAKGDCESEIREELKQLRQELRELKGDRKATLETTQQNTADLAETESLETKEELSAASKFFLILAAFSAILFTFMYKVSAHEGFALLTFFAPTVFLILAFATK
jgi:septal ring factor EnvC (AmiA/AmiB activator)